jgi:hypothetical protein
MMGHTEDLAVAKPLWAGSVRLTKRIFYTGRVPYLLLVIFIVVIYTSPAVLVPSLAVIAPAQIIGGLGLLTLAFEKVRNREGIWVVWPNSHLLFGFLTVATLSCLTATWAHLSFDATLDLTKYCLIYLLIVNTATTLGRVRGILLTMVIGGLFPALGTLHNYMTGEIHEGERVHWVGIFANSNDLAYSMVLLVPIAIALAGSTRAWVRPFFWGAIALYVATVYVTFSRGSFVALLAVLLLVGVRHRAVSVRTLTLGLVAASIVFAVYFWSRQEGFTNLSDFTFNQRLVTIQTGLAMFAAHPLLGVGLGGSVAAFPQFAPSDLDFSQALVIHNAFVQSLSEVGIFGCACFVLFVATGLIYARKESRTLREAGEPGAAALLDAIEVSLWGFIVCGLAGPYMMSWFPYLLIGVVAATHRQTELRRAASIRGEAS